MPTAFYEIKDKSTFYFNDIQLINMQDQIHLILLEYIRGSKEYSSLPLVVSQEIRLPTDDEPHGTPIFGASQIHPRSETGGIKPKCTIGSYSTIDKLPLCRVDMHTLTSG